MGQKSETAHWKKSLYRFAHRVADQLAADPNVVGVAFGGSVARGDVWKHSDLEIGIIVRKKVEGLQHFAVREDRGVETFQFVAAELEEQLDEIEAGKNDVTRFPIQMYRCRVLYDETGLFCRFKRVFDRDLFAPEIVDLKKRGELDRTALWLGRAEKALAKGHFKTTIALARVAMNNLLLAFYWHHTIQPRSQSRTVYMLKRTCRQIGDMRLYDAFCDLYDLDIGVETARAQLAAAKPDIHRLVLAWGSNAPEFFEKAVDGKLEWGYHKSIVTVHRFCLHLIQCREEDSHVYDDGDWQRSHGPLTTFLGLDEIDAQRARDGVEKIACLPRELGLT
jgi:predicted nucleotidyltransferase